jgi:adenine-specific DNA-methyltransferase
MAELIIKSPKKSLNSVLLKINPHRKDIEDFKEHHKSMINDIKEHETEEYHKNLITNFLKKTYYDDNYKINTSGSCDLVIRNGSDKDSKIGVMIEVKNPNNKKEMITSTCINKKSFHQLILYYLIERIDNNNISIKNLIVTNIYEWFIFDATLFEKLFINTDIQNNYNLWKSKSLVLDKRDEFYRKVVQPFVDKITDAIEFTYFKYEDYQNELENDDIEDDIFLVPYLKIFSPEHLFKLPVNNDSNSLDKEFYKELLHIIGLEERSENGGRVITRKNGVKRESGSIIEETITQLDSLNILDKFKNLNEYGESDDKRLYNIALELCLNWINRILFLKLLEAQLLRYQNQNIEYLFLNSEYILEYDDLNTLFFQVLSKEVDNRNNDVSKKYKNVPYLNSSLFEPTNLEKQTIYISNLADNKSIPIYSKTILKDYSGNKLEGRLSTLKYLLDFLNAYDFGAEGQEKIREDNKRLINSSVLGLIFEKINGYKEGSYFTPGYITEKMCRESIRDVVVKKFNEAENWDCKEITDTYNKMGKHYDLEKANSIINSIKICDPAVGSGHFLVSALNEMIYIKHYLEILKDENGKKLKSYQIEIINDELLVKDDDGSLFSYNLSNSESLRVQKTLFHEKQKIIENCLFGVDINPNSVQICRLRLWIELLKNSYYNENNLVTLPNIDINIRCGNSLISRFDVTEKLSSIVNEECLSIEDYRTIINNYRNAKSKVDKKKAEQEIESAKSNFKNNMLLSIESIRKLQNIEGQLLVSRTQTQLDFGDSQNLRVEEERNRLLNEKNELELKINEESKIYNNSFEWRYEFPEVLNNDGDFTGFDVVLGNPPYIKYQNIKEQERKYFEEHYKSASGSFELANLFFELAINISNNNSSNCFIFPNKFINSNNSEEFRKFLFEGKYIKKIIHFGTNQLFEGATTYTCIAQFSKESCDEIYFKKLAYKSDIKSFLYSDNNFNKIDYSKIKSISNLYDNSKKKNIWVLFNTQDEYDIFEQIYSNSKRLSDVLEVLVGLQTSKDDLYILECLDESIFKLKVKITGREYELERDLFKKVLRGEDIQPYGSLKSNKYVFFPYRINGDVAELINLSDIERCYPITYKYIKDHSDLFKGRESGLAGSHQEFHKYLYPKNLSMHEKERLISMDICSNHSKITLNSESLFHTSSAYSWVKKQNTNESYNFYLAIANSKLLWWFLTSTGDTLVGNTTRYKTDYLDNFPLPEIISSEIHDQISQTVGLVLDLKVNNPSSNTSNLEDAIDELVFSLYSLTDAQKMIILGF